MRSRVIYIFCVRLVRSLQSDDWFSSRTVTPSTDPSLNLRFVNIRNIVKVCFLYENYFRILCYRFMAHGAVGGTYNVHFY